MSQPHTQIDEHIEPHPHTNIQIQTGLPYNSDNESPTPSSPHSTTSNESETLISPTSAQSIEDDMSRVAVAPIDDTKNARLIIVDPISTGAMLAADATERGYKIIRVFSSVVPDDIVNHVPEALRSRIRFEASFLNKNGSDVSEVVDGIKSLNVPILGVIAGCETGVECADAIACALNCVNNDPSCSYFRRNKYEMAEQIRRCGVRAVMQQLATEWNHIQTWVKQNFDITQPFQIIIKPVCSAGSDGVYLCTSLEELKSKFDLLIGAKNILGNSNTSVVVQEYLQGKEYVVDAVSYNGVHKIQALWAYDKRNVNGCGFVYHGMRLMDSREPQCAEMIPYIHSVLDALNIRYGPSHSEVIITKNGPVLVETGARLHGGEGSFIPIVRACIGYDVITSSLLALQNPEQFLKLPSAPMLSHQYGAEMYFVSRVSGKWISNRYIDEIESLPSYHGLTWYTTPGSIITPTIDCLTMPGSVILLHHDPKQLEQDIQLFQQYNQKGVFVVEPVNNNNNDNNVNTNENEIIGTN